RPGPVPGGPGGRAGPGRLVSPHDGAGRHDGHRHGHEGRELALAMCARVLDLVGDRAEAEVTVTSGRSGLTRFANSFIHQNVAESGQWARLKVVVDGRLATASTSRLTTGLKDLVERALEAARLRPVD